MVRGLQAAQGVPGGPRGPRAPRGPGGPAHPRSTTGGVQGSRGVQGVQGSWAPGGPAVPLGTHGSRGSKGGFAGGPGGYKGSMGVHGGFRGVQGWTPMLTMSAPKRFSQMKTPNHSLLPPPQNKITRPTPLAPHVLGTLSVSPLISLPRPQPHDPTPSAPSASVHRDVSVSQTRAELTRRRWRGQSRTCSPSSCG